MRVSGVDAAIRNNIPASTYEGRGAGLSSGNSLPSPGSASASITETARAELGNASVVQSMMGPMGHGFGISTGVERVSSSIRSASMIRRSSWGF